MASDVKKPKGILKASSSFDQPDHPHHHKHDKEMKWDEMNILATHHPADKDYGHMKIDEPKTPYSKLSDAEDDDGEGGGRRTSVSEEPGVDPESIASRLEDVEKKLHPRVSGDEDESSSEDENETEEERAKRKMFEQKRKLHYNEFQAVKLAKQLMEEEDELDEEDETDENGDSNENTEKVQDQDKNSDDATPENK